MRQFSAGPKLDDAPNGDPRREAVASLRGYAYQLYVSALAWLSLKSGQQLYLEVAEDYAVLARNALNGVQVKDTAASGALTINHPDALAAIHSYVDLVHRNPSLQVNLRFLTTASLGKEQGVADRVDGESVLAYWRKAATGANVAPLREALLRASISDAVRQFIVDRNDSKLREDLLRRIHWDFEQGGLTDVASELEATLIEFASDRLQVSPTDCVGLSHTVVGEVLSAIVSPGSQRRLILADLLTLCEAHTKTVISTSTLARLHLASQIQPTPASATLDVSTLLEPINEAPLPRHLVPRRSLTDRALDLLRRQNLLFLVGGSGLGKTLAARLTAAEYGGHWSILELRDVPAAEARRRLAAATARIAISAVDGIVLDDLNQLDSPTVSHQLSRLTAALKRRDVACIVTCYRQPSTALADHLGLESVPLLQVETLSIDEVRQLVAAAGGTGSRIAELAYWHGGQGHPQLVRAFITIARRIGWEALEQDATQAIADIRSRVKADQRQFRQLLIEQYDENARLLLYRLSLLVGRFERNLALEVAHIDPSVSLAGEYLDDLIGPWIDELGAERLRISPLLEKAGEEVLSTSAQRAVHKCAADVLGSGASLDVLRADAMYVHAIRGDSAHILMKVAVAVLTSARDRLRLVAAWMPSLLAAAVDRPIYADDLLLSCQLRIAQVLLLGASDDRDLTLHAWLQLGQEIAVLTDRDKSTAFEYAVLGKVLIDPNFVRILPNPVELLERHRKLPMDHPTLQQHLPPTEVPSVSGMQRPVSVASLLFVTTALEAHTVARQREIFLELDKLDASVRLGYFDAPADSLSGLKAIANAAWLSEVKAGTLNWRRAAAVFSELATLVTAWGLRDLALCFLAACSAMLDEGGGQPDAALRALEEAEAAHGLDPILSRARARVHFRNKRYADALSTIEFASAELQKHDPLERAFICRETAISAANMGDWAKSEQWFRSAVESVSQIPGMRLRPISLGLKADHAIAAYQAGHFRIAIGRLVDVLTALPEIEDETSTSAIYCHRVVHHSVLWMYGQATGRDDLLVEDAPPHMEAGMCSNLEPPETIREQPVASPITTWHLLAAIEAHHLNSEEARRNLDERLNGRRYPNLELMTRQSLVAAAIQRLDVAEFVAYLGPLLDACAYLYGRADELRGASVNAPAQGEIDPASFDELNDPTIALHARSALLSFAICITAAGQSNKLVELEAEAKAAGLPSCVMACLDLILGRTENLADPDISFTLRALESQDALAPEAMYRATLRLVQAAAASSFRPVMERPIVAWAKPRWHALLGAPFLLKAPDVSIPPIERALRKDGLAALASALLAAEPALNIRLAAELRHWLTSVGDSRHSESVQSRAA